MEIDQLRVAVVQWDLVWRYPEANFAICDELLAAAPALDLAVLPEMFSSGFCMQPGTVARNIGERSQDYLARSARQHHACFCGSTIQYLGDDHYANRCYLTDGKELSTLYDKRHLFALAQEHTAFQQGAPEPTIVDYKGWRLLPQICYDLRFPVYAHNAGCRYDVAIYVANWPATRREHWRALLRARAIENQCFVVGVNRIGSDPNGLEYAGDTAVYHASGDMLLDIGAEPCATVVALDLAELRGFRQHLPFLRDTDKYELL